MYPSHAALDLRADRAERRILTSPIRKHELDADWYKLSWRLSTSNNLSGGHIVELANRVSSTVKLLCSFQILQQASIIIGLLLSDRG